MSMADLYDRRLQEIRELRESYAELHKSHAELLAIARRLAFLEHKDGGRTFPSPIDCAEARKAIANAEKLES